MNKTFQNAVRVLLITVFCMTAAVFCPGNVLAESSGSCGDNLTWILSDDGTLQISGTGKLTKGSWNEGSIIKVSIPEGVTSIEEALFIGCGNCESFNVASSNSNYASADGVLFNKDKTTLVSCPPGKARAYTIPSSVKTIATGAFAFCKKLTSVVMPGSVTSMGSYAFNCCELLNNIVISGGITEIPQDCFSNCGALKAVTIPEGVTKINASAFWGCKSLTKVTLPDSLGKKSIAEDAFEGCPLDAASEAAVKAKLNFKETAETGFTVDVGEKRDCQLQTTLDVKSLDGYFYADSSDESILQITSLTRNGSVVYANGATYYYVLGVKGIHTGQAVVTVYTDSTKTRVVSKITFTVTGEDPVEPEKTETKNSFATGFTVAAGAQLECRGEATVKGALVETAFAAASSDESVVKVVSIARGGNMILADAVTYFFTVTVKGVNPGKATVTLYADSTKKKVIAATTITVTGKKTNTTDKTNTTNKTNTADKTNTTDKTGTKDTETKTVSTVTKGGGVYKLSGSTAVLTKPKKKNITKLTIPATVSANGKKYKVTAVSANACKGLKKLKTVTIGKNVTKIGKAAFSGDKKLKKIVIKSSKLRSVGKNAIKSIHKKAVIKVPKAKLKKYKKLFSGKTGVKKKTMKIKK